MNTVTEGKIEEILFIFSVSHSQINSQLLFKEADIGPVAVCPKSMKEIGRGSWEVGWGKVSKIEGRIPPYN